MSARRASRPAVPASCATCATSATSSTERRGPCRRHAFRVSIRFPSNHSGSPRMTTWIVLALLVALVVYVISIYNGLVALRNRVRNAFSQIDVQLQRRYDLIPNLVETARAFMQHERETLEAVIQARNAAKAAAGHAESDPSDGGAMRALIGAEAALGGALGRFFALAEAYPDLK